MKRIWALLMVIGLAGTLAVSGCARQDETAGTSTDSTLSLGEISEDAPEATSPAPGNEYTPGTTTPARTSPPPRRTPARTTPRPDPTPDPTPARTTGVTVPAGTTLTLTLNNELNTKEVSAGHGFTATLAD